MSSEENAAQEESTTASLNLEQAPTPEQLQEAPAAENKQPIKTDVDELEEIFSCYSTIEAAKQAMRGSLDEAKRFVFNGKTYSQANCRKAINRIKDKDGFSGEAGNPKGNEPTARIDEQPLQEIAPLETMPASSDNLEQPYQQPQQSAPMQQPPKHYDEIIVPQALKKQIAKIVKVWFDKGAKMCDDESFKMDSDEAENFAEAAVILFIGNNEVDPRAIAALTMFSSVGCRLDGLIKIIRKVVENFKKGKQPKAAA